LELLVKFKLSNKLVYRLYKSVRANFNLIL
jgi:hypothetical protein